MDWQASQSKTNTASMANLRGWVQFQHLKSFWQPNAGVFPLDVIFFSLTASLVLAKQNWYLSQSCHLESDPSISNSVVLVETDAQ